MALEKRQSWSSEDNELLIMLWNAIGCVPILSMIMERSVSSIQTQASRLNLPSRDDGGELRRRKFSKEEIDDLKESMGYVSDGFDGKIPILALAKELGIGVGAAFRRMEMFWGDEKEVLDRIIIPDMEEIKKIGKNSKNGKQCDCLSCRKPFWSAGSHNRVCDNCKRNAEWD